METALKSLNKVHEEKNISLYLEFLNRNLVTYLEDLKKITELIKKAILVLDKDIEAKTEKVNKILRDNVEL